MSSHRLRLLFIGILTIVALIGVVIGVLLNPRDSVIAFSSVQPISLKHEGYVQFNINLLR
jgi:hypothetical protein